MSFALVHCVSDNLSHLDAFQGVFLELLLSGTGLLLNGLLLLLELLLLKDSLHLLLNDCVHLSVLLSFDCLGSHELALFFLHLLALHPFLLHVCLEPFDRQLLLSDSCLLLFPQNLLALSFLLFEVIVEPFFTVEFDLESLDLLLQLDDFWVFLGRLLAFDRLVVVIIIFNLCKGNRVVNLAKLSFGSGCDRRAAA